MTDTYDKFEGGVAVVIVVAFLMVGVGILRGTGAPAFPPLVHHVSMTTLHPEANGVQLQWNALPCSTDGTSWNELDDPAFPGDEDATCRQGNVSGGDKSVFVAMEDFVPPAGALSLAIDSVTAAAMVKRVSGDDALNPNNQFCSGINGGPVCGTLVIAGPIAPGCVADEFNHTASASWTYITKTWTTCGGGAAAWNVSNLNVIGTGLECYDKGGAAEVCRGSQLSLNVTYSYDTRPAATPTSSLALLLPFAMVAVAVVFAVAWFVSVRRRGRT